MTNSWNQLITSVAQTPANQRLDACFSGIAEQMEQVTTTQQIQQLGQQLQQAKSQLIKALTSGQVA